MPTAPEGDQTLTAQYTKATDPTRAAPPVCPVLCRRPRVSNPSSSNPPSGSGNPLVSDADIRFLLGDVFDVASLLELPAFEAHSVETVDMYLATIRRFSREQLYPAYQLMDRAPPQLIDGRVHVHPLAKKLFAQLVDLGVLTADRSEDVGGFQLPSLVTSAAMLLMMAANLAAVGYVSLTSGAAHLIEVFGDDALRASLMVPMYAGRWAGTMALTEPDAGSSLADLRTAATPTDQGHYLLRGTKIFISGGDQDITENLVHLTLARIDGAPAGIKGVSLFAVPARRPTADGLVYNDVYASQLIHKIGTRGLASVGLTYGDQGDCRGWLVGPENRGMSCMFQLMNEARISVGVEGAAAASVAYHEALAYARARPQGRPMADRDPTSPQRPILVHADVRRLLLRQKAIVEGGIALVLKTAQLADLATHTPDGPERARLGLLLGLLTPVCKSFPAERGLEANSLAMQVHGGYGYTSEYPVESWWRDQRLNSIHEGTTGIQGLDLLGRKVMADRGAAVQVLGGEMTRSVEAAMAIGVEASWCAQLGGALRDVGETTRALGDKAAQGDAAGMLLHSADYLEAFSIVVVAWLWLDMATAAARRLAQTPNASFYLGKRQAARYYFATELPKAGHLLQLCRDAEPSYGDMQDAWF